jgi:dipeptidyl aminopeptidase/acylaminoacyl peptidase
MNGVTKIRIRPTMMAMAEPVEDSHFLPANPKDLLKADPKRRSPVRFRSAGLTLAGHLYRPPKAKPSDRTPGIVMCGPISSVKEQTLPHYAERISQAGFTVLTFDPRSFGESEGEPRAHYDPNRVVEDYANAVTYLCTRQDIDPARVGIVGVCMGGGFAVSTAARHRKVKAVVAIAGGYSIGGTFQRFMGVEGFAGFREQLTRWSWKSTKQERCNISPPSPGVSPPKSRWR